MQIDLREIKASIVIKSENDKSVIENIDLFGIDGVTSETDVSECDILSSSDIEIVDARVFNIKAENANITLKNAITRSVEGNDIKVISSNILGNISANHIAIDSANCLGDVVAKKSISLFANSDKSVVSGNIIVLESGKLFIDAIKENPIYCKKSVSCADGSLILGSKDTKSLISIKGLAQSNNLTLSGDGMVSVEAISPIKDKISVLTVDDFNSNIETVCSAFDTIKVVSGSLICLGIDCKNLEVSKNATVNAAIIDVKESLKGEGTVCSRAGGLSVYGTLEGNLSLMLTGSKSDDDLAFKLNDKSDDTFIKCGFDAKKDSVEENIASYIICDFDKFTSDKSVIMPSVESIKATVGSSVPIMIVHSGQNALEAKLNWESSDESVASLAKEGMIVNMLEAKSAGEADITAVLVDENGESYGKTIKIHVKVLDSEIGTGSKSASVFYDKVLSNDKNIKKLYTKLKVNEVYNMLASSVPADFNLEFVSSDENVATISLVKSEYTTKQGVKGQLWGVKAHSKGFCKIEGFYENSGYGVFVEVL